MIATALIALIWIGVVVIGKVGEPVKVLAMAGATYAVIGIAMAVFLQAFFTWGPEETASIPFTAFLIPVATNPKRPPQVTLTTMLPMSPAVSSRR